MGIGGGRCGGGKHGLHVGQAPNPAAGVERPTKRVLPWPLQKHPFRRKFNQRFWQSIPLCSVCADFWLMSSLLNVALHTPGNCCIHNSWMPGTRRWKSYVPSNVNSITNMIHHLCPAAHAAGARARSPHFNTDESSH